MIPHSVYMKIPYPARRFQFELSDDLRDLREDLGEAFTQFRLKRQHRMIVREPRQDELTSEYVNCVVECSCGNYTVGEMNDSAAERRTYDHRRDVGIDW